MKVHVPSPLHDYTNQRAVVEAVGATLRELLEDLDARHPGVRFRVVAATAGVRDGLFHVRFGRTKTRSLVSRRGARGCVWGAMAWLGARG